MPQRLDRPRLYVDFNEMLADNLVLLAKNDEKTDSEGTVIVFSEGLAVHVFMDDPDKEGKVDFLVADGVCKRNLNSDWSRVAKWTCEIDCKGIRQLSELP